MKPINPINPIKPIRPILLSFLLLLSLSAAAKEKTYTLASPDGVNAHRPPPRPRRRFRCPD